MRVFSFLIVMIFCTSCDKLSFSKNKNNEQLIDTIVDYTSVDTFPSFTVCDSIIDKIKKQDCFRNTIHQKIGEELQKHTFTIKDSIDKMILVDLIINAKGEIVFDGLNSEKIKTELPELESVIRKSVGNLPKVLPAVKRGIPVTTKYQLPIRILLEE